MTIVIIAPCRLTANVTYLKETENRKKQARFRIADNVSKDKTFFYPCVAFGNAADKCRDYKKGQAVSIEGRIGDCQGRQVILVDQIEPI